jgi:hypothetical protein
MTSMNLAPRLQFRSMFSGEAAKHCGHPAAVPDAVGEAVLVSVPAGVRV